MVKYLSRLMELTWQRRGFSSLNGAFVCISWLTGRVLDFYVSSKFCHHCTSMNARILSPVL